MADRRYIIDPVVGSVAVFLKMGPNKRPDAHVFRIEDGKIVKIHTITSCGTDVNCGFDPLDKMIAAGHEPHFSTGIRQADPGEFAADEDVAAAFDRLEPVKLRYTRQARADLDAARTYIARAKPRSGCRDGGPHPRGHRRLTLFADQARPVRSCRPRNSAGSSSARTKGLGLIDRDSIKEFDHARDRAPRSPGRHRRRS